MSKEVKAEDKKSRDRTMLHSVPWDKCAPPLGRLNTWHYRRLCVVLLPDKMHQTTPWVDGRSWYRFCCSCALTPEMASHLHFLPTVSALGVLVTLCEVDCVGEKKAKRSRECVAHGKGGNFSISLDRALHVCFPPTYQKNTLSWQVGNTCVF